MDTDFLIIGAGPFGLAAASQAQALAVDHIVVGQPMSFWRHHMPRGMVLRSDRGWDLDPTDRTSLADYMDRTRLPDSAHEPISLAEYLDYADGMIGELGIAPIERQVTRLDRTNAGFRASLDDGAAIGTRAVLLALGFADCAHAPSDLVGRLGGLPWVHTSDVVSPEAYRGERVLVIGGRQSAFETAALLAEAGASAVHVACRHAAPAFARSDWSWVGERVARFETEPRWYRDLSETERADLNQRFWAEGRLKLEPWLGPRVRHPVIDIHPQTTLEATTPDGPGFSVTLERAKERMHVEVDRAVLATGYKMDASRIALLAAGGLADQVETADGVPVLDERLQTSVPGLFMTSFAATASFGPFFAFTAAARASARIIGNAVRVN